MMYVLTSPQIMNNLAGKGNFIQPQFAAINCSLLGLLWTFQKEIFHLQQPMHLEVVLA